MPTNEKRARRWSHCGLLDAELNLPAERYSFGIRRRAAEEATKGAYDEVAKILRTQASAAVAKRQVEEVVRRAAQDFDSYYLGRRLAWLTETTPSSTILVLTLTGATCSLKRRYCETPCTGSC